MATVSADRTNGFQRGAHQSFSYPHNSSYPFVRLLPQRTDLWREMRLSGGHLAGAGEAVAGRGRDRDIEPGPRRRRRTMRQRWRHWRRGRRLRGGGGCRLPTPKTNMFTGKFRGMAGAAEDRRRRGLGQGGEARRGATTARRPAVRLVEAAGEWRRWCGGGVWRCAAVVFFPLLSNAGFPPSLAVLSSSPDRERTWSKFRSLLRSPVR
jgi:hypothetical protein